MSGATTVPEYLAELEPERRELVSLIRAIVNENIDPGFEEMIDFGMIAWVVPLEREPDTYNGHPLMYAALASQKRYVSLYLMGIYSNAERAAWFRDAYVGTGLKPDMGKSCVRFTKPDAVPTRLIGEAVSAFSVESFLETMRRARNGAT